jgi:hypothetical protein
MASSVEIQQESSNLPSRQEEQRLSITDEPGLSINFYVYQKEPPSGAPLSSGPLWLPLKAGGSVFARSWFSFQFRLTPVVISSDTDWWANKGVF